MLVNIRVAKKNSAIIGYKYILRKFCQAYFVPRVDKMSSKSFNLLFRNVFSKSRVQVKNIFTYKGDVENLHFYPALSDLLS